jgi:hypothetical protein
MMDYRVLLKKYMDLVISCEGVSFLGDIDLHDDITKTDEEFLLKIEKELERDNNG